MRIARDAILVRSGASATIRGGVLDLASFASLAGYGDLVLDTTVIGNNIAKFGPGTLTFGDAASFSDFLQMRGGRLLVGANEPLRKALVSLAGGTVFDLRGVPTAIGTLAGGGSVLLGGGTLTIGDAEMLSEPFSGTISGSGGLRKVDTGRQEMTSALSYPGPTAVTVDAARRTTAGELIFSGGGSALGSSGWSVTGGMTLTFDNSTSSRMDRVPLTLDHGTFQFSGNSTAPILQTVGVLEGFGHSTIRLNAVSRKSTWLAFDGLHRNERATIEFAAVNGTAPGPGVATVTLGPALSGELVGSGATATSLPILPFAVGITASGFRSLVTYDPANGIRPLTAAEFTSALTAGANVRLTASMANDATVAVNSLTVTSAALTGAGRVEVTSGAVLLENAATIANAMAFGGVEGVIFSYASSASLTGTISGGNGLTISGPGGVSLLASNTFSGPLTINAATLTWNAVASLGAGGSLLTLNDARLVYSPSNTAVPTDLSSPVRLSGYVSTIRSNTMPSAPLILNGTISGTGGLRIEGPVTLTGVNSYSGITEVGVGATLTFNSDAALGAGSHIFSAGTMVLAGPWVTSKSMTLQDATNVDTAGFDAIVSGSISGSGSFYKRGAGTLTLTGSVRATNYVTGGTLCVDGTVDGGVATVASNGGTLSGNGNFRNGVAISASGTLAPGHGIGTMMINDVTFQSNSTLALEIASVTAFDLLKVAGSVSLNSPVNLALSLAFDPVDNVDSFLVLANDGPNAINGIVPRFSYGGTVLEEGAFFAVGNQSFRITYTGGNGNDVVLHATPEPSTGLLSAVGFALLGLRRRRS